MLDFDSMKFDVVQKKKIWFIVPAAILALAIVVGIIYGFVFEGDVFNLGMDFTGGYSLNVVLGTQLNDDAIKEEQEEKLKEIIESDITGENGEFISGLLVKSIALQGEGADMAFYVKFTSPYNYGQMMGDQDREGYIDIISRKIIDELVSDDIYAGYVTNGDTVSATVSSELIMTAICGVIMSVALMLIYIAIRFELLSGVVAVICLMHDISMMVLFMLFFHIEITSTFVAALITILGYSINNTIIIFDKVRENSRDMIGALPSEIANSAVKTTLVRSINTTITTFITVLLVCIASLFFNVMDLVVFTLPLMAGLIAGTFSSVLIAPSIWEWWKQRALKKSSVETISPKDDGLKSFKYDVPELVASEETISTSSTVTSGFGDNA